MKIRITGLGIACLVLLGVGAGIVATSVFDDSLGALYPCATEDSTHCYWDGETMGNGTGQDVVTP